MLPLDRRPFKAAIVLFLVFILPSVLGYYNVSRVDDAAHGFIGGVSSFNNASFAVVTTGKALTAGLGYPLVADLDADGTNEVIVYDNGNVRLYHGTALSVVDAVAVTATSKPLFLVKDYDADGFSEVLYTGSGYAGLNVLSYNGTSFHSERTIALTTGTGGTGDKWLGCSDATNRCVVAYVTNDCSDASTGRGLSVTAFNSTTTGTRYDLEAATVNQVECSSAVPVLSVGDNNNDAFEDIVFNYYFVYSNVAADQVRQKVLRLSPGNLTVYSRASNSAVALEVGQPAGGAAKCCSVMGAELLFASPMVFDFDGAPSNGNEIVDAYLTDSDTFKLFSYSSAYVVIDDYPEVLSYNNGERISNIVRGTFFSDSLADSFCALGFRATAQQVSLFCGSLVTSGTQTIDFTKNTLPYRLDDSFGNGNVRIQSIKAISELEDGTDIDEVLTTFGVFDPVMATCDGFNDCDLDFVFASRKANMTVVSVDPLKVGREDMVGVTPTNVWYFDDAFSNAAPTIGDYSINPCVTSTWIINSSVEVALEVSDPEGDDVRARVILYADTVKAVDSGYSALYGSGTTIPFSMTANSSASNAVIRFVVEDVNLNNRSYDLAYSVSTTGASLGDCLSTGNLEAEVAAQNVSTTTEPQATNAVATGLQDIDRNLGVGTTVLWLLLMVGIGVAVLYAAAQSKLPGMGQAAVPVVLFIEGLLVVVGAKLSFLSTGMVVIVALIGAATVAYYVRGYMAGSLPKG